MKRSKLCIAFSILFGLFVPFLLTSSDANALKHQFNRMPLYNMNMKTTVNGNTSFTTFADVPFAIGLDGGEQFHRDLTNSPKFFNPKSMGANSPCEYNNDHSYYDGHMKIDELVSGEYYLYTPLRRAFDDSVNSDTDSFCYRNVAFGTHGMQSFNYDSVPLIPIGEQKHYNELKPFSYEYASYTYKDQFKTPEGIVYDSKGLALDEIVGADNLLQLKHPNRLKIPIGLIKDIQSADFVDITQGTSVHFFYELYFTELDSITYDMSLFEDDVVKLHWEALDSSFGSQSGSMTCNKNAYFDGYGVRFQFDCDFVSPFDVYDNLIEFWYDIKPGAGRDYIWNINFQCTSYYEQDPTVCQMTEGNVSFFTKSLYTVTDYDETPGGEIGGSASGSDPGNSPGSVINQMGLDKDVTPNYDASLVTLFGFSIINPFAPIFNLFTNNSSCVQIPTIAGMIHSNETQVCPWFNSTTRNIVTPVLGLASMMLVFGFVVRWLGARSGNLFEDSFESDNYTFSRKRGK